MESSEEKNEEKKRGMKLESLLRNHQKSFKSFFKQCRFGKPNNAHNNNEPPHSPKPIPQLSPLANAVVSRCSKILQIPTEELQHHFDTELPESVKQLLSYARNFIEFCSYQTIDLLAKSPDYLSDKEFLHLTFDMMLAWEAPSSDSEPQQSEATSREDQQIEDEDGWSFFYSSSTKTAVEVNEKKTVGAEAFARIAPACTAVADVITVHNLFDALTSSSGGRLHLLIYGQYLRSLDKIIKAAKSAQGTSVSNLQLAEGEVILDVDGTVPIQPVLQHIGISAWPGRLTLTNYAFYFEGGVGLYEKPIRYDLALDMKQVIKPELTGPLGARLFDRAVMYKSTSIKEPVFLEFPEFKGNIRRDYWLNICREIFYAHSFIRRENFKSIQLSEVLARAILGIFRCRAVRETFHIFSSNFKTLLVFNLAETLPGGDIILDSLHSRLTIISASTSPSAIGVKNSKQETKMHPFSLIELDRFGIVLSKENLNEEASYLGDVSVGETNPLEMAIKSSVLYTERADAAQATIDKVKVDGIDTNLAVLQGLVFPIIKFVSYVHALASWNAPIQTFAFLLLSAYAITRGWYSYILPSVFVLFAILMLWYRFRKRGRPLEAFKITLPAERNAVEQLLTLQDAITQLESLVQDGNITLLKIRALILAVVPQATERVAVLLIFMAALFVYVPFKYISLLVFLERFTMEMPLRKQSSDRVIRRIREWWVRIPAAPVELIKADKNKKNK